MFLVNALRNGISFGNSNVPKPEQDEKGKEPDINTTNTKKHKLSYGASGRTRTFLKNIEKWSNVDEIPGITEKRRYEIYRWGKFNYSHQSIVIGCIPESTDDQEYDYFSLELRTSTPQFEIENMIADEKDDDHDDTTNDKLIIFPYTERYNIDIAKEKHIDTKEWLLEIKSIELTIENLCHLTLELINHHGEYSLLFNNCQNFVSAFIYACNEYIYDKHKKNKDSDKHKDQDEQKNSNIASSGSGECASLTFLGNIVSKQYKMIKNSQSDVTKAIVIGSGVAVTVGGSSVAAAKGKGNANANGNNIKTGVTSLSAIGFATSNATVGGHASMVAAAKLHGNECEKVKLQTD